MNSIQKNYSKQENTIVNFWILMRMHVEYINMHNFYFKKYMKREWEINKKKMSQGIKK